MMQMKGEELRNAEEKGREAQERKTGLKRRERITMNR